MSQALYYAFQFQNREGVFSPILHAGRLNQEYVVDAWVYVEANHLNWVRTHHEELRADCYNRLQDAMEAELEQDAYRFGHEIILPSLIPGTPRHMKQLYQDSMAICRHYGHADFFITFISNPQWEQITASVPPGFSALDSPEIVVRVFNLKLKVLLHDLVNKHILGTPVSFIRSNFRNEDFPIHTSYRF